MDNNKVLSGEVAVNKKELQELSAKPAAEIEALALEIEDGSYERKPPAPKKAEDGNEDPGFPVKPGELSDSNSAIIQRLVAAINSITNAYHSELRKLNHNREIAEYKTRLRLYIDTLEELYTQI